jgi:hypothetical protein
MPDLWLYSGLRQIRRKWSVQPTRLILLPQRRYMQCVYNPKVTPKFTSLLRGLPGPVPSGSNLSIRQAGWLLRFKGKGLEADYDSSAVL